MLIVIVFCLSSQLTSAFIQAPLIKPLTDFNAERSKLMSWEQSLGIGGQLRLTADEFKVDNYLRKLKKNEV